MYVSRMYVCIEDVGRKDVVRLDGRRGRIRSPLSRRPADLELLIKTPADRALSC